MNLRFVHLLLCLAGCAAAPHPTTLPRADDVASPEALIAAFYAVVDLAPDAPRQWDRDRALYRPELRFVGVGGDGSIATYTHAELVAGTEPMMAEGFREREIHRVTRRYGNMVHVDSTYETVHRGKTRRGVNSIDMIFDGSRWWIASVVWQTESARFPIPAELLPAT